MRRALNITRKTVVAQNVEVAATFWERLIGLIGRSNLKPGAGLLIEPCRSVHTFFMRFPIDVIFIDGEGRVAGLIPEMKAFCLSGEYRNVERALELPIGTIKASLTTLGDIVEFSEQPEVIKKFESPTTWRRPNSLHRWADKHGTG